MTNGPFESDSLVVKEFARVGAVYSKMVASGHRTFNGADALLADTSALASLLNACFWMSLSPEEGRMIHGTVVIADSTEPYLRFHKLGKPQPSDVQSLLELLAATARPVAVRLAGRDLEIWGMLEFDPVLAPSIKVLGPGVLAGVAMGSTFTVASRGVEYSTPGANRDALDELFTVALGEEDRSVNAYSPARLLTGLVRSTQRHGHGGSILVVTPGATSWKNQTSIKYSFDPQAKDPLVEILQDCRVESAEWLIQSGKKGDPIAEGLVDAGRAVRPELAQRLAANIEAIGRLTAIDGAVVIESTMRVLGFGAKLQTQGRGPLGVERVDMLSRRKDVVDIAELGGMRHQSAARFVAEHSDCVIVVSSMDGRLTAFKRAADGTPIAMTGLQHLIWAD